MFLAFGVVPHQWIAHADPTSAGRATNIIYGPAASCKPQADGGWFPFTLQYEAIRDIVVVLIHVMLLRAHHLPLDWWQKRGDGQARHRDRDQHYGRPLVKKG